MMVVQYQAAFSRMCVLTLQTRGFSHSLPFPDALYLPQQVRVLFSLRKPKKKKKRKKERRKQWKKITATAPRSFWFVKRDKGKERGETDGSVGPPEVANNASLRCEQGSDRHANVKRDYRGRRLGIAVLTLPVGSSSTKKGTSL